VFQPNGSLQIVSLTSVDTFSRAMDNIRATAAKHNVIPLYHYTAPFVGSLILKGGLRMSSQGQGDGGVYVSTLGPASYGIGSKEYEINIIKDCFGADRINEYLGKGNLDAVMVYACAPCVLEQTPGGRVNSKMFSKTSFEKFSLPKDDGNFFLRTDRIFGCFYINPKNINNFNLNKSLIKSLQNESYYDHISVEKINKIPLQLLSNGMRIDKALMKYHITSSSSSSSRNSLLTNGSELKDEQINKAISNGGSNSNSKSSGSQIMKDGKLNSSEIEMIDQHQQNDDDDEEEETDLRKKLKQRSIVGITDQGVMIQNPFLRFSDMNDTEDIDPLQRQGPSSSTDHKVHTARGSVNNDTNGVESTHDILQVVVNEL